MPVHPRAFDTLKQYGKVSLLSHQFVDLMAQVGLRPGTSHKATGTGRDGKRKGMDISYHSLRHSAVSLLKDAGVPDAVIMALVGHDSVAMSARHTSIGKESLVKAREAQVRVPYALPDREWCIKLAGFSRPARHNMYPAMSTEVGQLWVDIGIKPVGLEHRRSSAGI